MQGIGKPLAVRQDHSRPRYSAMTIFHRRSKQFLRQVSEAAAWMMKRNVGHGHWWRWSVLTAHNPDPLERPILDDGTARAVFEELERRELLQPFPHVPPDGSGAQAYLMRYDVEGWDRAVSDGRPLLGALIKAKRSWGWLLSVFILGCIVTSLENRTVGFIDEMVTRLICLFR